MLDPMITPSDCANVSSPPFTRAMTRMMVTEDESRIVVATGAVATTILDSSSVTIILVIALVNGGLLTFAQSLGVIMGSNIGTTVSSQIFATDVEAYAPVVLLVGFAIFVTARNSRRRRSIGLSLLGLGLVFFGLHYMGEAVEPLRDNERLL